VVIVQRNAVRAIVLTPESRVLLMRIRPPEGGDWFWITPGGGLEAGESEEQGLRRELREELALERFDIGPLVWRRQHTFNWGGRRICQRERYRIVHVAEFEPRMSDAVEARVLDRFRWWHADELAKAQEQLTPMSLADIVANYLAHGAPADVSTVEVLVD
jgi:8-oxo-dGTP pyrophosphatase MutT (NUDIX family)